MRRVIRVLVWVAYLLAIAAGLVLQAAPAPRRSPSARATVAGIVSRIQKADFEDDRPALRRLYEELAPYRDDEKLASRVRYWRGFALWRRALNGFNDSADKKEQEEDLSGCVSEFDQAAAKDPAFIDARAGAVSCLVGLFSLDPGKPERRQEYVKRYGELQAEAKASGTDNPRVLWLLGGGAWYVPVERGGGQARALEIYGTGLEAARRGKGPRDPLDPSWGEPELLMNLAWSNLHRATPDLDVAEANARAALALVPNWHYVRDILLPQILEARGKTRPASPPPGPSSP